MNSLFYRGLPLKQVNKHAYSRNQFLPICLKKIESKVFDKLVARTNHSSTSATNKGLWRPSVEHNHVRSILKNQEKYHFALFDLQLEQNPEQFKITDKKFLRELQDWVFAAEIVDRRNSRCEIDEFSEYVSKRRTALLPKLEQSDISNVFRTLSFCVYFANECMKESLFSLFSHISGTLMKDIDVTFEKKLGDYKLNEVMLIADAWTLVDSSNNRQCIKRILKALLSHLHIMKDYQVVFTFYLLGCIQNISDLSGTETIESEICPVVEQLSLDEMAIIGYGFFRGGLKITNEYLEKIIVEKFVSECANAHEETIALLSEVIQNKFKFPTKPEVSELIDFQERLIPQIHKLSPIAAASVMSFGTISNVYNEKLVAECVKNLKPVLKQCRLKELDRILTTVLKYQYQDDELIDMIIEELKIRISERHVYSELFLSCTYSLVMKGIIIPNFIKLSLAPKNVEKFLLRKEKIPYKSILSWVDAVAELEVPNYDGPRISAELRKQCADVKEYSTPAAPSGFLTVKVDELLKQIYGERNVASKVLLPQYCKPFSIVGFDYDMNLVSAPQNWLNANDGNSFISPPDQTNIWVAVQAISCYQETAFKPMLLSLPLAIRRHLLKLGYYVTEIQQSSWNQNRSANGKQQLVKNCVENQVMQAIQKMNKKKLCFKNKINK